ncbi:hypothetical protein GSI_08896 [Ganoderma sinense ZZ0214-1]|uniref:DUF6534 domain-containing protein n=1 Tax=Ganoderma sinense ZZ0214-1 TaxID=1077348 RepID=A0A2G8S501_9APHY|nr:hypothetical protein GSI_08896 [Ganoderma sinense ZZ0214-1]
MTTTQPDLAADVVSGVKESLACLTIGAIVSMCILDTISAVLTACGLYEYVVVDFGNPPSLLVTPPVLAVLIGALTQLFFAQRLWALSKRNKALVSSVALLALCSFGTGIRVSVHLYTDSDIYSIGSLEIRILTGIAAGTSTVCDVAIVVALCYYLRSRRTGFPRTNSMIGRLVMYAVNRGILTAVCTVGEMITIVAFPGRFIFIPFALLTGRLYCNTLLATLNVQKSFRRDDDNIVDFGPDLLHRMNVSTLGNGNSQRGTVEHLEQASILQYANLRLRHIHSQQRQDHGADMILATPSTSTS